MNITTVGWGWQGRTGLRSLVMSIEIAFILFLFLDRIATALCL